MQLYGGKTKQGKAPDRGSFPLDHHSECKTEVEAFLRCLQESSSEHVRCKRLSKAYLQGAKSRLQAARGQVMGEPRGRELGGHCTPREL